VPGVQTWGIRFVHLSMRKICSFLTVKPQTSYVCTAFFMWLQSGNQIMGRPSDRPHHLYLLWWKSKFFYLEVMKLVHLILSSSLL
jgi:hypothetical protein